MFCPRLLDIMTEGITATGYTVASKDMDTTAVSLMSQGQQKTYNINTLQQRNVGHARNI